MNAEIRFKDKRILEALEYIDEKYIDDVFDVLKEPIYSKGGNLKISHFKRWRHYLAAAACLLVLALATPLFTHLPEIINSFAAGWGSETDDVSDTLDIPETTEELVSDFDPNYVLTEEDRALFEAAIKKEFNKKEVNWNIYHFYGKCGDSIIYWNDVWTCMYREIIIEDYVFATPNGERIRVQNGESIYTLEEAYEKGIVTYADIVQINKVHLGVYGFTGGHIVDYKKITLTHINLHL